MPDHLRPREAFSGPVVYVGDGDSLCVALGPSPAEWVEVRLADFYAPELHEAGGSEAKASLGRLVEGKSVDCIAAHRSYDRVVAICRLRGRSVGDLLRAAGVKEGGRGK
jgi:micrococcal nuclease